MKGYIKIESATHEGKEGLSVEADLRDVSYMDRIVVVNGVCDALHIKPTELKLMADLIGSSLMDELVSIDTLRNDDDEPQGAKKKPNVHAIGLKSDGDGIAELLKMLLS